MVDLKIDNITSEVKTEVWKNCPKPIFIVCIHLHDASFDCVKTSQNRSFYKWVSYYHLFVMKDVRLSLVTSLPSLYHVTNGRGTPDTRHCRRILRPTFSVLSGEILLTRGGFAEKEKYHFFSLWTHDGLNVLFHHKLGILFIYLFTTWHIGAQ